MKYNYYIWGGAIMAILRVLDRVPLKLVSPYRQYDIFGAQNRQNKDKSSNLATMPTIQCSLMVLGETNVNNMQICEFDQIN